MCLSVHLAVGHIRNGLHLSFEAEVVTLRIDLRAVNSKLKFVGVNKFKLIRVWLYCSHSVHTKVRKYD